MAYCSISKSGSTTAIGIIAEASEVASSGIQREMRLCVKVKALDEPQNPYVGNGSYAVSCVEADVNNSSSFQISNQEYATIFDETFWVTPSVGSTSVKINFTYSVSFTSPSTGKTVKISGGISEISGLSRVVSVGFGEVYNTYFGDNCNLTWWADSSLYYYKLKFRMGSYEYMTEMIHPNIKGTYAYTGFIIPNEAANSIPNATSGTMTVMLYQYEDSDGNVQSGPPASSQFTVFLKEGEGYIPSVTSANVTIDNSSNAAIDSWGVAVAGYSKLKVDATASGIYSSLIQNFSIECEAIANIVGSELAYTSDIIKKSGSKSFVIKVTDTRGRVSKSFTTSPVSVLSYAPPKIDMVSISKSKNSRFVISTKWKHDSVNGNNTSDGKLYYKVTTDSFWTLYGAISNNTSTELTNITPNETASYIFRVVVTDAVGNTAEKEAFASTRQVLLDFRSGGKGLGVGKICESDAMEVAMDAKFYNEVYIEGKTLCEYIRSNQILPQSDAYILDKVYPVGSIYMSTQNISPASLFLSEWEVLENQFLLGAGSLYSAGDTGGEAEHTLSIAEMPSHNHWGVRRDDIGDFTGTHSTGTSTGGLNTSPETNYTGGSQPHNNMPPYLVVYMWQRTK